MNLSLKEKLSYGLGAVGKDMVYMLTQLAGVWNCAIKLTADIAFKMIAAGY